MDDQKAIVFVILDRETGVCGYTWFIEAHRTSFYIKSMFKPMQVTKVSIHGPDAKHIGKDHFRLDFTHRDEARKAIAAGGGWGAFGLPLPLKFTGRRVNKRTVHLARFSAESGMFRRGMQRGPDPQIKTQATLHAVLSAPPEGSVTHVDLYVSSVRPFWLNRERELRLQNAGMGPLVNEAGMFLTAIVSQKKSTQEPDPFSDVRGNTSEDECIRGIAEAVDSTGLLWICEKMIPNSKIQAVNPPGTAR